LRWGRNKKSRRGGMLVQLIFRQGSGVPPDSGKTVLRSGLVLKLKHQETAGQTASAEKLSPAEIVYALRVAGWRDLPQPAFAVYF
jgi:hypothetical protein